MIRSGGVRVLHLRHNPEAEARQEAREAAVTQLRAENEALRGQVAELEAAVAKLQEQQNPDNTGAAVRTRLLGLHAVWLVPTIRFSFGCPLLLT